MIEAVLVSILAFCFLFGLVGFLIIICASSLEENIMQKKKKLVWEKPKIQSIGGISEGCVNYYCQNGNKDKDACLCGNRHWQVHEQ